MLLARGDPSVSGAKPIPTPDYLSMFATPAASGGYYVNPDAKSMLRYVMNSINY